jgi:hypothetical protein
MWTLVRTVASSLHCGYPLGLPLIASIVQTQRHGNGIPIPDCWQKDDVDRFVTRLARSGHYSIDAFLETVPGDTDLGKYLIAYCLKQFEDVDRLFPPNSSGWYQYLFNSLLGSSSSPFSENAITLVTYNYDRSLEAYLYHALIARFDMSPDNALVELEKIPIIHVHGELGAFPRVPYEQTADVDALHSTAASINIIHEITDAPSGFCSPEFEMANAAINDADKVAFLGFGFHTDNIRRLDVDWSARPERKVMSTFAQTSPQLYNDLIQRLSQYGFSTSVLPNTGGYVCENFFQFVTTLE